MKKSCLILLIYPLIFFSCEKDKKAELTELTDQCVFQENIIGVCFFGLSHADHDNIVIKNNTTYQNFGNSIRATPLYTNCDTAAMPKIDFEKYTLLGKWTEGGGCGAEYVRQIFENKTDKKIVYRIDATYSGLCMMLLGNWNWVYIPKLPDGYSVEFQVNYQNK